MQPVVIEVWKAISNERVRLRTVGSSGEDLEGDVMLHDGELFLGRSAGGFGVAEKAIHIGVHDRNCSSDVIESALREASLHATVYVFGPEYDGEYEVEILEDFIEKSRTVFGKQIIPCVKLDMPLAVLSRHPDLTGILATLQRQNAAITVENSDEFWTMAANAGFKIYGLWGSAAPERYWWEPLRIPRKDSLGGGPLASAT